MCLYNHTLPMNIWILSFGGDTLEEFSSEDFLEKSYKTVISPNKSQSDFVEN